MPADDEDLLLRLGRALQPDDSEPSAAELDKLRTAVAEQPASLDSRRVWPWRAAAGLAAAAVLILLVLSPPLPEPLRRVARGLGLPVDSVEVAEAKSAAAKLRSALDEGDRARVARASERLQRRLEGLDEADRRRLAGRTGPLFERARRSGSGAGPAPGPAPPGVGPTTPGTVPPRQTTTSAPSSSTTTTTSTTVGSKAVTTTTR